MPPSRVVLRNPLPLRLMALPLAVMAVASWAAVGDFWVGSGGGFGVVGRVLMGAWLSVLALLLTNGAVVGGLMRETIGPDEVTVRAWVRTRRFTLAEAQSIRQQRVSARAGLARVPFGRLQIVGPGRGVGSRAFVDETLTHAEAAMGVLDEWVRRRPELVAEDAAARSVFVARGVLTGTETGADTGTDTDTPGR